MELGLVDQLAYCTVRIECDLGNNIVSTGTGFFFHFCDGEEKVLPAIVTNKHVLAGAQKIRLFLTKMNEKKQRLKGQHEIVEFDLNKDDRIRIAFHPENLDMAIITLGKFLLDSEEKGIRYFFKPIANDSIPSQEILDDFSVMEDIIMVGYPSGMFDEKNNMPIIRKGITATHPALNYQGRSEFVADIASFPGSSGSPVFLLNLGGYTDNKGIYHLGKHRLYLLGLLYAGPQYNAQGEITIAPIPTTNKPISQTKIPMNLGYIIKSNNLLIWEEYVRGNVS